MIGIVYKATNKLNNKVYIGKTIHTLHIRKYAHINSASRKAGICPYFHKAIGKYGKDCFDWETIYTTDKEDKLMEMEKFYISVYNSNNKEKGYNLTKGGDGISGFKHSKETKKKLSEMKIGNKNPMYGKSPSKEHREKISKSNKNRQHSRDVREKISKSLSGENHFYYGKKHSKEHCMKMSKSMLGKNAGEKCSTAKLNWNIVKEIRKKYETGKYKQKELAKIYGVGNTAINHLLKYKTWKEVA